MSLIACDSNVRKIKDYYNEFVKMLVDNNWASNEKIEKSEIIALLEQIIKDKSCYTTLERKDILYRARNVYYKDYTNDSSGIKVLADGHTVSGFNEYESKEPPLWSNSPARNNIAGETYLYLAKNVYTACCEVRPMLKGLISVAQFQIQKPLKILDFSRSRTRTWKIPNEVFYGELWDIISNKYSEEYRDEQNYKVTQFFADYIRKTGIDGVAFDSCIGDNVNYTIFNCHKNNIAFVSSKLFCCYKREFEFLDLNNQEHIVGFPSSLNKQGVIEIKENIIMTKNEKTIKND